MPKLNKRIKQRTTREHTYCLIDNIEPQFEVVEISADGFSFACDHTDDRFGESMKLPDISIVNGEAQEEPFTKHTQPDRQIPGRDNFGPITVPEDKFFMLGDNRENSRDSRYWGFVDYSQLRGKALFIYWSWDKDHNLPRLSRIFDLVR
mgnify:CR=1 FL=1